MKTYVKSGPFAPQALPCFVATMGRSDSRPWPPHGYGLPYGVAPRAPRRVSQDSQRLCRRAPSPTTPDDSPGAAARCFPGDSRLHHLWKDGHRRLGVTRSNRVRLRWAHAFAVTGSQPARSPARAAEPVRFARWVARPRRTAATCVNEQFTWLTPFSQQESPELTWRTRDRQARGEDK
jgi:hypothetical protein